MYRPVQRQETSTLRSVFFGPNNYTTLETVLVRDFEEKNHAPLTRIQRERLTKTLDHYIQEIYQKQGEKPLPVLNREVLQACAKDYSQYLQRKEAVKSVQPAKHVAEDRLFQDTSQRYEQLTQERNDAQTKALPPPMPDFHISLSEDGPPAAELFERAKKQREWEMLRQQQQETVTKNAEQGIQNRLQADQSFRALQDLQNKETEQQAILARNPVVMPPSTVRDTSLVVLPDRRELMKGPIGSFDSMTAVAPPLPLSSPPSSSPLSSSLGMPPIRSLPQDVVVREEPSVSYRELESNLFIYSADRDWLKNNKENRYRFTVLFDPASNGQSFGPSLSAQQKFKNIVRVELVKVILPGESLGMVVQRTKDSQAINTDNMDNVLNYPFLTLHVEELGNNNYGTSNMIDRAFGVLQYDSRWVSDASTASKNTRGFLCMIPKFMKAKKEYYPTPLSTLQKLTIQLNAPNGQPVSLTPDTFDVAGILAPQPGEVLGTTFPFTNSIKFGDSPLAFNVMIPSVNGAPANFYINTSKYFSKFDLCVGDRIQLGGYTYDDAAFADPTYGQSLRSFCQWINRPEGHIVLGVAHSVATDISSDTTNIRDGPNDVGYANFVVIPARYQDPTTGSVLLDPFGPNFGATLNAFGASLQSPIRLLNQNRQVQVVFRVVTQEMDPLAQIRPDNNY